MFTAAVIDVMMENGIDFDGLVGVSAARVSAVISNPANPAASCAIISVSVRIRDI